MITQEQLNEIKAALKSDTGADQSETFSEKMAENRVAAAEARQALAEDRAAKAEAELSRVKAAVDWCMEKGLMRDLFNSAHSIPFPEDKMEADPEDTARLDYINKHGRTWLGTGCFCFALPHGGDVDSIQVPEIYNIRHIVDICRGTWTKRASILSVPSTLSIPSTPSI